LMFGLGNWVCCCGSSWVLFGVGLCAWMGTVFRDCCFVILAASVAFAASFTRSLLPSHCGRFDFAPVAVFPISLRHFRPLRFLSSVWPGCFSALVARSTLLELYLSSRRFVLISVPLIRYSFVPCWIRCFGSIRYVVLPICVGNAVVLGFCCCLCRLLKSWWDSVIVSRLHLRLYSSSISPFCCVIVFVIRLCPRPSSSSFAPLLPRLCLVASIYGMVRILVWFCIWISRGVVFGFPCSASRDGIVWGDFAFFGVCI
jgi:hypothetical protein